LAQLQKETNSEKPTFNIIKLEKWLKSLKIDMDPEDLGTALTDLIKEGKLVIVAVQEKGILLSNSQPSVPLKCGPNPTPWSH